MLTPVIMITALGDDGHRTKGIRVGANAYMTKPYGTEQLFDAIDQAQAWHARMVQGAMQGEIHVQLNSELPFLQEVNDFLLNITLVDITYRIYPEHVEIVVRDQGEGFDPANISHAASEDDPIAHMDVREKLGLREGGFGLMISRGLVDELRHNEVGNEVTLIKRFSTAGMDG